MNSTAQAAAVRTIAVPSPALESGVAPVEVRAEPGRRGQIGAGSEDAERAAAAGKAEAVDQVRGTPAAPTAIWTCTRWRSPRRFADQDLQDERRRAARLAEEHAGKNRRRPSAVEDPRAAAVELRSRGRRQNRLIAALKPTLKISLSSQIPVWGTDRSRWGTPPACSPAPRAVARWFSVGAATTVTSTVREAAATGRDVSRCGLRGSATRTAAAAVTSMPSASGATANAAGARWRRLRTARRK